MAFQVPEARAQGRALTTCAKFLWDLVGKPLTKGMLSKGGELVVEHFAGRVQKGETTISDSDVRQLAREYERRGMTECEMRRQLEAMYGAQDGPPTGYSAQAYCQITGAIGNAQGQPTPQHALMIAVRDCIYRGGIPGCCEHGAYPTR